jgi:cell division protein FtsB
MNSMDFLSYPKRVFVVSSLAFLVWVLASGYLFEFYRLSVLEEVIHHKIAQLKGEMSDLEVQLKRSQDHEFIRKQAIENLGLADQNDLIFLFP